MSRNIDQIYIDNPATSMVTSDLLYLGRSPFDAGDDFAITWADMRNSIKWNVGNIAISNLGVGIGSATPKFKASILGLPTITSNASVTVPFNSVIYDNYNFFNTGTNSFQPSIAGMYYIYASMYLSFQSADPAGSYISLAIARNGIRTSVGTTYFIGSTGAVALGVNVSDVVQLNGSSDIVSCSIFQTAAAARSVTFAPTSSVNNSCIMVGSLLV